MSTRNRAGALAEFPVERRTVSDRVHTRQTTTAHAAQDQSQTDPPVTTPLQGRQRVRRGASPGLLPWQGPAAGTKSQVLGRPPHAPCSRPVKLGATAPLVGGRHHGDGKANWSTESDRTGRGAAHRHGATRHAREERRRPQARHKEQRPPGAANSGSAHNTRPSTAREKVPRTAKPQPRTPHPQPFG